MPPYVLLLLRQNARQIIATPGRMNQGCGCREPLTGANLPTVQVPIPNETTYIPIRNATGLTSCRRPNVVPSNSLGSSVNLSARRSALIRLFLPNPISRGSRDLTRFYVHSGVRRVLRARGCVAGAALQDFFRTRLKNGGCTVAQFPQGLKPPFLWPRSARLKSCPDTKRIYETRFRLLSNNDR